MKLLLIFAVAFVAEVISDGDSDDDSPWPDYGTIGDVGYVAIGDTGNSIWVIGDDMEAKNAGPIQNLVGAGLKFAGDGVITVGDDILAGAGGDIVVAGGRTVKKLGKAGILGNILGPVLIGGGDVVEKLGGDQIPE